MTQAGHLAPGWAVGGLPTLSRNSLLLGVLMSKSVRLALGLTAAAVMMTALGASASARNLSSTRETFRVTWNPLVLTDPLGNTINCPVTLEGTFIGQTIPKVTYTLMGRITEARVGTRAECTGGEATVLRETLPWHIRYNGFEGRLPNITNIRTLVAGASFRVFDAPANAICLFTSRETTREHIAGTFNREFGGVISGVSVAGSITSNEACAFGIRIAGVLTGNSNRPTILAGSENIRVTLI
jgi:hypothetical protein